MISADLADHPDRPLPQLRRVPPRRMCWHDPIPTLPKDWSIRTRRGDSRLRGTAADDLTRHTHSGKGHGRTEERLLLAAALDVIGQVHDDVTFPDAAQVARIVRHRGDAEGQRTAKETVHVITSLPTDLAGPATLAALVRGHWSIEALHHVRDQTFREDSSRVRTGHAPTVLAAIRNTITAAIRLAGHTSIAAARREATLDIRTAIAWFTTRTEPDTNPL